MGQVFPMPREAKQVARGDLVHSWGSRRDSLGDPCWLSPATSTWPCCSWPPWMLPTQVSRRSHLWGSGGALGREG